MQTRLGISGVVLVLSAGVSVQTATACSKEAVAGAVDRWTTVLAENNPDTIVALYSKDAVLWGTLSPTVRSDPAGLKAYFVGAYKALPKLTVKFGEQFIRVYGDTAVNTGYYTLFYTKDGEAKSIPARYSFTYVKDGNDCKIVDHHSSAASAVGHRSRRTLGPGVEPQPFRTRPHGPAVATDGRLHARGRRRSASRCRRRCSPAPTR